MQKFKKPLTVIAIVMGALVLGAVIMGVLNALVADGAWHFGWESYRYEDSGYEIGGASVPSRTVRHIDLDWLDGDVTVLPCDDKYISLSEKGSGILEEEDLLRWHLSEDGSTLTVKYRKSAWFLSGSEDMRKELILRIPREMLADLQTLSITTRRGNVSLSNVEPKTLVIDTQRGDVTLSYTEDASFSLVWTGEKGSLASDLPLTRVEDAYLYRDGRSRLSITSKYGDLTLKLLE